MKLLELKMRLEEPNETFANFRRFFRAKRIFCELFPGRNGQMKLLATFTG